MEFKFSKHAIEEMGNRDISISLAMQVLSNPQQIIPNGDDLLVYQSIIDESEGKFLIRVFFLK